MKRTHHCNELRPAHIGQTVLLSGWVHSRRDLGGLIFIDVRDREGLVQVVSDPDRKETFANADRVRNEFVLRVTGVVRRRPEGTVNPNMKSGEIEVTLDNQWGTSGQVCIRQSDPLPLTLVALTTELVIGG